MFKAVLYFNFKIRQNDTLASINEEVVQASGFLKSFAADKQRQECLDAFCDCQDIVNWIRNLGKNKNEENGNNHKK